MVRKGKAPPKREITRRRLARWQRERRRRRIIITLGVLIILTVMAVIVYGFYTTSIAPPRRLLSTVNGTSITAGEYRDALRLYPYSGSAEAPLLMLEENELVRQGAEEFIAQGAPADELSVSDDEIDERIKDMLFPEEEEIDEELYQQMLSNIGLTEEDFRGFIEASLLSEKLDQHLRAQVPEVGVPVTQVHVQAILVATEEEANDVKARLEGGEDFAALAAELSLDEASKENGGDLGWLPRGIMSEEFDEVAFSIEIGEVSQSFSTAEGYYIIKVLEEEERALDEDVRGQLEANAFYYWLEEQREEKVERNPNLDLDAIYRWALGQIS
ncbi:MAG: peptidylprolyl isomerase [Dehalococcoidia bacterium]|nr:peptidylprolyl isomerase [Dehalococcoidia bacterium]